MGIIQRLILGEERDPKMIWTEQPLKLVYALETLTHILNQSKSEEDEITRDDVIMYALDEYLRKNLWATPETTLNRTEIKRAKSYDGTGRVQRKSVT